MASNPRIRISARRCLLANKVNKMVGGAYLPVSRYFKKSLPMLSASSSSSSSSSFFSCSLEAPFFVDAVKLPDPVSLVSFRLVSNSAAAVVALINVTLFPTFLFLGLFLGLLEGDPPLPLLLLRIPSFACNVCGIMESHFSASCNTSR